MMLQSEMIGGGQWALILGPYGLLFASIIVVIVLWRKLNAERKEYAAEIAELHNSRHSDLASGLRYREEIGSKLLENSTEDRVTAHKLIDAMKSLSSQQEKTDGTVQMVKESVQEINTKLNSRR